MMFAWDLKQFKWDHIVLAALRVFRQEFGHCNVYRAFTVPSQFPWPEPAWGLRLGDIVATIRGGGFDGNLDKRDLEKLGFVWSVSEAEWNDRIMPAFETFHRLNGHCRVHKFFVVPSDENWPTQSWGMKLGSIVNTVRSQGSYSTQVSRDRARLEEMGFVFNVLESDWSERIMPAFENFHRLNGHCRVPLAFVVPSDENWPTQSWGLKLGSIVSTVRSKGSYSTQVSRDRARLEEMGFVFNVLKPDWSEQIMPAFKAFHQLNGHCRVPIAFVVPSNENWPTQTWGLKLGSIVNRVRSQGSYSTQVSRDRARLEELGFVWNIIESKWSERVLPALQTFCKVYGHCRVHQSFIVPTDADWPENLHGLKLGLIVRKIRNPGIYFDQVVRSLDLLVVIEFNTKIPARKWGERVEPMLVTFEELHGHRVVLRDFVVPSSSPWNRKDWGIPLGKLKHK
ncbi:unnamed protein product [Phytophthora fragariaefolia]|uniref:Unnamed protein product n=1 Tax=Phytophthora fragariaefolia TaxID=1490495 RepID=A0A9W6Y8V6_9STRA|nr:unnamed protein product [Phytophthora fragariaefolia]